MIVPATGLAQQPLSNFYFDYLPDQKDEVFNCVEIN